jgi:cyclophilin family peptidyl-prolyl cis-trans isomerase
MVYRLRIVSIIICCIVVSSLALIGLQAQENVSSSPDEICAASTPAEDPETREYDAPEQALENDTDYYAIFCTEAGAIYVDLFEEIAPITVNNFVFLAQNGFYNNTTFHRVLENFMAQGGDPTGTGSGGPGYAFVDELASFVRFDRVGLLAMANAGPGTNGSQFFITTAITDWLDFDHTIFGEVVGGQDVVENIKLRDPEQNPSEPGAALNTIIIIDDPDNVEITYPDVQLSQQADYQSSIEEFADQIQGIELISDASGVFSTEDWVQQLPDNLQNDFEDFLTEHSHQYTVAMSHISPECDLESIPFETIGYTIHVFETPNDVTVAMNSDFLEAFISLENDHETIESDLSPNPIYTWTQSVCGGDGIAARMYQQIGRTITVAESRLPEDRPFEADEWLQQVVRFNIYEAIFGDELRLELDDK